MHNYLAIRLEHLPEICHHPKSLCDDIRSALDIPSRDLYVLAKAI